MKKLSFFLMAMILCFAPALRAADVTETIAMKKFGGLSTSSYENVTKTGTSDKGTEMVAYAFNPTTGQVRGSKTAIAGASITSKDDSKNWSLYNTQAMPGAIKKITVTQTATGSNYFRNNLYVALGTTNQGAVTTVTGAQKTTGTATEFTFVIDETQGYTYFKLLSNEKFTSGSVAGVVVTVTYAEAASNPDAVKYTVTAKVNDPAMGTVSGAGEYEEGKTATLTANANAGYKFVNWSNGSTANPLKITVTENVEITANFEAIPQMTCAEAAAAASGATVVLNPFDVVYVVKGAGYTYIKDDSGVNLIFDYTMDDQFKAGDHVEGFVGVSSPYNGLPEIKPTVAFADLKVTPGTAPEATVFETVPTKEDVNKYVVFKGVKLTSNISYNTSSATNATISVGGKNVTLRNTFKLAASLTSGSTYDIYAFVAIYNGNIQMYYASSVDVSPERTITATVNPAETGTVTGAGTYKEGKTATLKATPTEGYAFTCWTEGEDTVSTAANYSFKVAADRALVANFAQKTYNVTATAENGTVTGAGEYIENAEVTLTATPAEGYEFTCWTSGEDTVSTANPYKFTVTADVALVANFKEVEPEIEWMKMDLEITNLVTEVMEVGGAKFLQLMGRDDMNDADVTLFLNNYADVDDDYVVNAESSYMTFGGMELTVLEGTMTQTSETAKGTIYKGTVRTYAAEEERYVEFALTMYAAPVTVLVLTDAIVAVNEKLGTLTFNVPTGEDEGYYAELAGYTAPGVHQGPQICLFSTPEVVSYTNYAETSVADGIITLKGEFTSPMGPKFNLTISGKLPGSATALDNLNTTVAPVKAIINGQLIIINNGVQYNAQGQVIK